MKRLKDFVKWAKRSLDKYYGSVKPYRLNRTDKLVGLFLAAVFLALYLLTCSHHPNIAGDSPELIASSFSLGIPHPPGYPLYTMIGYVFTHIPIGSIAFRLNFLSVILHTLTLLILFIVMMKITRSRAASIISVSILGLSYNFWFYSLIAEVFPLNDLFIVLLILVAILVRDRSQAGDHQGAERLFLLLAFLAGLSLTNHHTILLVFPALILFTLRTFLRILRKPKRLIMTVLVFLLGLIPYIYLPIRASQNPHINFTDPSSFRSFFDVVTRRYYGTTQLWKGPTATHRLDLVFHYITTLNDQVYLLGIGLGILGMLKMAKKRFGDFLPLITTFFLGAVAFLMMANVTLTGTFQIGTIERFYLLPTIIFTIFIAMGISGILAWIKQAVDARDLRIDLAKALVLFIALLIALPFLLPARKTMDSVNMKQDYLGESYINDLIWSTEEGAVVFCYGDTGIHLIHDYYMVIQENWGDIIPISFSFWSQDWHIDYLRVQYPDLSLPLNPEELQYKNFTFEQYRALLTYFFIQNNPQITSYYIMEKDPELERYFQLIPYGMTYRILPKDAEIDYDSYYQFQVDYWRNIDRQGMDYTQYTENRRETYWIAIMVNYLGESADFLEENGRLEEAAQLYLVALDIYPLIEYEYKLASILLELGKTEEAEASFRTVIEDTPPTNSVHWQAVLALEAINAVKEGL